MGKARQDKEQSPEAYQDDLAYIHDVGFGGFATGGAPGLLDLLRKGGISEGLVVDLGCGSGLWARELVRAGYQVLGVDISAAMLKIARRRVPQARFQRASFLAVDLPPCRAITALGECFNYLFEETNTAVALEQYFSRVYRALMPGGMLVFDVAEPGRGGGPGRRQRNCYGDDWAMLLETEENAEQQTLTRRITSFLRIGKLYRRSEETHRVRLVRGAELLPPLRRRGFRVRRLKSYGNMPLGHGVVGIVARKPVVS